jgi:hypothetical protein
MGSIAVSFLSLTPIVNNSTMEVSSSQIFLGVETAFAEGTGIGPSSGWHYSLFQSKNGGAYDEIATSTGPSGIPSGAPGGWNVLLTGLSPSTPYSFTLSIIDPVSGYSTSLAGTLSTTTQAALNYTTNLIATTVTNTSVSVTPNSWVPAGNPWNATTPYLSVPYTYAWYRSTTSGTRGSALSGATSINLADATVSASTTYYYTASISDGTSTVFSTQFPVTTLPNLTNAAPTLISYSSSQVVLTVTSEAGGVPPYARQWYRSTSSGFTPGPGNILTGQTATTLTDTTVVNNTTYYYKYVTTDNNSDTATSAQTSVTTYATMGVATPTASTIAATSAVLSISAATGGSGTNTYAWYISQVNGFVPSRSTLLTGVTSLTPTIDGLTPLTTYYFVVVASDNVADSATSGQLTVTTTALPLSVGALIEEQVSSNSVTIACPNPVGGVAPYSYAWTRTPAASPALPTTQTITDITLTAGDIYTYACTVTDSTPITPQTAVALPVTITATPESDLGAIYQSLLIYQYIYQPNASAIIDALGNALSLPATSTQTADNILANVVENAFGIGTATSNAITATGTQLNYLGNYLGVTRTVTLANGTVVTLDDQDFGTLILLAAAQRAASQILTTGPYAGTQVPALTVAAIDQILWNFFPNEITMYDNANMTLSYIISATLGSTNLIDAIINEKRLPKPLGVGLGPIIVPPGPYTTFFGFATASATGSAAYILPSSASGFNVGVAAEPEVDYMTKFAFIDATWNINP